MTDVTLRHAIKVWQVTHPDYPPFWCFEVRCRHGRVWMNLSLHYDTEIEALRGASEYRDNLPATICNDVTCFKVMMDGHRRDNEPSAVNAGPAYWTQGGRW